MLKPIDHQNQHNNFPTEIKMHITQASKLHQYIDKLQDKINYTKWKQQIILQYNYMPLKNIADKITNEKLIYQKKVQAQSEQCLKILNGTKFTKQMEQIRQFYQQLQNKIREIQLQMDQQHIKRAILEAQILDKKTQLQNMIRENKRLDSLKIINSKYVTQQQQSAVRTFRSQSSKKPLKKSFCDQTTINRQSSILKYSANNFSQTIRSQSKPLYFQCLDLIIGSIRSMKSSEDVQNGIFLDIMSRKKQNSIGRFSLKSSICHTLFENYAKKLKQTKRNSNKNDFDISWETFQTFNWKQVMGVIMVKDRESKCLKNIMSDPN